MDKEKKNYMTSKHCHIKAYPIEINRFFFWITIRLKYVFKKHELAIKAVSIMLYFS